MKLDPSSFATAETQPARSHCQNRDNCAAAKPTTHCRRCSIMKIAADPVLEERRLAAIRANFDDPAYRAAHIARVREVNQRPEVRASRVEHGKFIYATVLSRPDVLAKNRSPEVRAKAGRATSETMLSWCPPERRDEYKWLVRWKHIPAVEARRIIEADLGIESAEDEARRIIDQVTRDMQAKQEREKAQAY
jgi:hypothetical protein